MNQVEALRRLYDEYGLTTFTAKEAFPELSARESKKLTLRLLHELKLNRLHRDSWREPHLYRINYSGTQVIGVSHPHY